MRRETSFEKIWKGRALNASNFLYYAYKDDWFLVKKENANYFRCDIHFYFCSSNVHENGSVSLNQSCKGDIF
jgi:hypothetical protein